MPPPAPNDNARVFILIILLLWVFSSGDTGSGFIATPSLTAARLARQRQALGVLNASHWGDFAPGAGGRDQGGQDGQEGKGGREKEGVDNDDETGTASDRYLNITGFREQDGYAWEDLGRFRDRCLEWSRNANPPSPASKGPKGGNGGSTGGSTGGDIWDLAPPTPVWQNITGVVSGEWIRRAGTVARPAGAYNLSAITPHMIWAGGPSSHAEWSRNVTGGFGKVVLVLDEKDESFEYEEPLGQDGEGEGEGEGRDNTRDHEAVGPLTGGLVREVSALATIQDDDSGLSQWDMRLHGVHWPRQGAMLLTTTSEKFAGIFGLPHLTPGPEFFRSSQTLLNRSLAEVIRRKERTRFTDPSNPWTSTAEAPSDTWNPVPHCEYVMYLQVHPVDVHQLKLNYYGEPDRGRLTNFVKEIENELRHPTGAPIKAVPDLHMSLVAWSPDCSFYLESKGPPLYSPAEGQHLVGMKQEILNHQGRFWVLAFGGIMFAQAQLLKGQMKESRTPSTLGRVSFYTASVMLLADGVIFAGSAALGFSSLDVHLPALVLVFASFMSMLVGMVFVSDVYKVQEPERRLRTRPRGQTASGNTSPPRATTTPAPATATLPTDTLPRPVTAGLPRLPSISPIIIPSDQDIDAEIAENAAAGAAALALPLRPTLPTTTATTTTTTTTPIQPRLTPLTSLTGRFIMLGCFIFFLSVAATSWPSSVRATFTNAIAFLYLSLWVPQIWRNVQRNSRRAFAWRFMLGQSALRLLPFAYFYLRGDNVLFTRPDPTAFAALAAWVWVQLWALAAQDILGPRFAVPDSWAPHAWDYHPVLREDAVESGGLPIGLLDGGSQPTSPVVETRRTRSMEFGSSGAAMGEGESTGGARKRERDKECERKGTYVRSVDCAICREVLEVPVVRAGAEDPGAGGVAGLLARRAYMVTPCRHIFHAACLEGWLRYRLQCPICREELPPL